MVKYKTKYKLQWPIYPKTKFKTPPSILLEQFLLPFSIVSSCPGKLECSLLFPQKQVQRKGQESIAMLTMTIHCHLSHVAWWKDQFQAFQFHTYNDND